MHYLLVNLYFFDDFYRINIFLIFQVVFILLINNLEYFILSVIISLQQENAVKDAFNIIQQ